MGLAIADFTSQQTIAALKAYRGGMSVTNIRNALTALATSVGSDPAVLDITLTTPAAANNPSRQTVNLNREATLIVNKGRGGRSLTSAQMSTALTSLANALPLPPVNTGLPVLGGTAAVGQQVLVSTGSWSGPSRVYSYQWLNDAGAIPGATNAQFTCRAADQGHMMQCEVTATNAYGATTVTPAAAIGPVA